MSKARGFMVAAAVLALVFATGLSAAAGDLDPTFDADGKVITDFEGGANDVGWGVAIQPDRKIIVTGDTQSSTNHSFAIVRYNANGALDATFDGDGKVRTDFTSSSDDHGYSVALQSDGKIIAAGLVGIPGSGTSSDFGLARYNADGTLDTSFDGDGKVVTDFASGADAGFSVAVQSDGKIVAAGVSRPAGPGTYDFAVARYNPDGSLDPSFDGDGRVVTPISEGSDDQILDVAVQTDGKLVVGGYALIDNVGSAVLVRYTPDGSLDSSFDGDGKIVRANANLSGLALQTDGKIVTAGSPGFVTRYNPNGSIDTGFGSGGTAYSSYQSAYSAALAVQPDGKIVVGGSGSQGRNFAVARFEQGGSPDASFGSGGEVETVLGGAAGSDIPSDLGLAPDGKIVLAGATRPTSNGPFDFAVVRHLAAPPPCKVPNVRGKKLAVAKASIRRARCVAGKVTRKLSKRIRKGRVISQSPRAGRTVPSGGKVSLVVSKGRGR